VSSTYRRFVAEDVLVDGLEAFTHTCNLIGPLPHEAQMTIIDAWRRVLGGVDEVARIAQVNNYTERYGLRAGINARMRRTLSTYMEAAQDNSPPARVQENAPADWFSAEAGADQISA
jgi:hypothetical protein